MFKNTLYVTVIAILLFFVFGFFLPRYIVVERSIVIERPESTLFVLLNSFRSWPAWSPWMQRDPGIEVRYTGPNSGIGAGIEWEGDPRLVGTGSQVIIESVPASRVVTQLQMEQQGQALTFYELQGSKGETQLTWRFESDIVEGQGFFGGILARYFGLFFDQWIGKDFEQGLKSLKAFAESLPATDFSSLQADLVFAEPVPILYVEGNARQDPGNIADSLTLAYGEITAFMSENGLEMQGQPMAITRGWDEEGYRFSAAIPANTDNVTPTGNIQVGATPQGHAVRALHVGPYDQMSPTYEKLAAYMAAHGLKEGNTSWEHFISDPGETPTAELITHIYFLLDDES